MSNGSGRTGRSWWQRAAVLVPWVGLVVGWLWWSRTTETSAAESLQNLLDAIRGHWWSIPIYVALYAARPLVLFPASVLTVAGGVLFGPVLGVAIVVVASNLSALVAFSIGRWLRADDSSVDRNETRLIPRWSQRLRDQSFATVLVMRLAYLPYDLVNYACGMLGINAGAFLAATAIGSLPGTVSFVLAGASLQRLDRGLGGFDPAVFAASVALFAVSLAVARRFQQQESSEVAVVSSDGGQQIHD